MVPSDLGSHGNLRFLSPFLRFAYIHCFTNLVESIKFGIVFLVVRLCRGNGP